ARLGRGDVLVAALGGLVALAWREGRLWSDSRRVIRRVLFAVSPEFGQRALRAHALVERAPQRPGESEELARLHYERLLEQASEEAVTGAARKRGRLWRAGWIAFAAGTLGMALLVPLRVAEGLDVLFARDGKAPVDLLYLIDPIVTVELPSYLRESRRSLFLPEGLSSLPEGSLITVR